MDIWEKTMNSIVTQVLAKIYKNFQLFSANLIYMAIILTPGLKQSIV